jgi:glycosyltransferase involved in cell wall biosynthesis
MQGGAVTLARLFNQQAFNPDVILATDMFDLSTFRALTRFDMPCALYFHENQLTYPQNSRQHHGWQYGFINYTSALVADAVYFNSAFHRAAFLDELPRMLKHFGDFNELETVDLIRSRSWVLPLGLDLQRLDGFRVDKSPTDQPPLILWNHRWEADKNPGLFLESLIRLAEDDVPFRVALVGENFRQEPQEFQEARKRLGERVVQYGYVADFADYARLLWEADYVVSTAYQDFFGIAIAEAVYCECISLLPFRLNYPALIPERWHDVCLYRGNHLYALLKHHLTSDVAVDTRALRQEMAHYDWSHMAGVYDEALSRLAQGQPPFPDN